MTETQREAVAQADAHLNNAGLPTVTTMLNQCRELLDNAEYAGIWDGHATVLKRDCEAIETMLSAFRD